jgi:enoyl-CoA hydratase/carnithine racemase
MAVNGHAVGIGATMQLPAAIRIATATAKIGFVFSRRGVVMEGCSSYFLPRLIGYSRAMHLTTTGSTYLATDPLLHGLYSEILPTPERCRERALQIADDIARNTSLVSSHLMKEMMFRDTGSPEGQHLVESRLIVALYGGRDNVEGVRSFFEKRPPKFAATLAEDTPSYYPWWQEVSTVSRAAPIVALDATKSKL